MFVKGIGNCFERTMIMYFHKVFKFFNMFMFPFKVCILFMNFCIFLLKFS
jgi:hypothetical protein